MKRLPIFFTLIFVLTLLHGCDLKKQSQRTKPIAKEKPKPDVSAIVAEAVEIREEKLFLVTLEFKKKEFTLDLWEHAKNEIAAESQTLIVGERTFDDYAIGQEVSSKGDTWGFIFNSEIAEYIVTTVEKKIESQYFWVTRSGQQAEIKKEDYDEAIQQLAAVGRQLLTVPFAGFVRTYVLEKPLTEYQFVEYQPLNRYFVTVRVENSTFTPDITKHIRNGANTHDITLEVPRDMYKKTGDVWRAKLNTGSLIIKGHLSKLSGKVIKNWSEVDSNYQIAKTTDNQQFILPK